MIHNNDYFYLQYFNLKLLQYTKIKVTCIEIMVDNPYDKLMFYLDTNL